MYHPNRGGTRGGQAEFTWDQVRADQHRENYLGHSILAPTGRWQNNKDVNWYNKDKTDQNDEASKEAAAEKRRKELYQVKMREEEEMNKRLGIKPGQSSGIAISSINVGDKLLRGSSHDISSSSRAGTGSNKAPLDSSKNRWNITKDDEKVEEKLSKEDRRAARHLAKIQVREERRRSRKEEGHRRHERNEHSSDREAEDGRLRRETDRRDYDNGRGRDSRDGRRTGYRERDHRESASRHEMPRTRDHPSPRNQSNYKRDRSRSPGRSITPEIQRRRRRD